MSRFKLLDTIATLQPIALERLTLVEASDNLIDELPAGQVGTIVNIYQTATEPFYLVEFADLQGREYAMATLKADEILVLHYEPTATQIVDTKRSEGRSQVTNFGEL